MTDVSQVLSPFQRRIALACVLAAAALLALSACASNKSSTSTSASTSASTPAPTPADIVPPGTTTPFPWRSASESASTSADIVPPGTTTPFPSSGFQKYNEAEEKLVTANAHWRSPKVLTVDHSDLIGLRIQSDPVGSQINTWWQSLPGTDQPAGPIRVSPNATARLEGGDDATVKPSDYQNQSTGSDVDLGFVWTVTPKKPTSHLILTAYIEVRLEGIPPPNDTITTVKTLDIAVQGAPPVPRPPLPEQIWGSIKDNTPVWSPFVGTGIFGGVVAWIVKKIRRRNQATDVGSSASATEETPTESAEPQGEAAGSKPSRAQTNDTDH